MRILDGKALAEELHLEIGRQVEQIEKETGLRPRLAVVRVGDDPASVAYVAGKKKAAQKVGIRSELIELPAETSPGELEAVIRRLNEDDDLDAILLQLPLPGHLDSFSFISRIDPQKDVDCFHPQNFGKIIYQKAEILPCTPAGVVRLLEHYRIELRGKRVAVVGRSVIVGKPLALMLLNLDATVTICHSRTESLEKILQQADIVVAAVGRPGLLKREMFKPGVVLIDIGINQIGSEAEFMRYADPAREAEFRKKGYLLIGDIDYRAYELSSFYTPVPGGVGPLTVVLLLENTLQLFRRRRKL